MPTPDIRTAPGKKKFVNALCNRIRDVTIERIPDMPKDWDGIELRKYLADMFADEITASIKNSLQQRHGRSLQGYRNTIAKTATL